MITLHESNITSFPLDNGIGVLSDVIKATATEELNGMFEFYMEYDSEGSLVDELKKERIIKAKAQDKLGYQLFRIYSITKNHENDNLIINAQHVTYDLANNFVEELKAESMTKKQVMELIGSSTNYPHRFNVTSSNTTTRSSTSLYRTNPLQMIGGMEGSVLQIWGGQIERDNFNLIMHDRRGSDDGVKVLYKKNLTGLTAKFDIENLVTRTFPYKYIPATDDEPEQLITVPGKYIDSPYIDDHEMPYILPVDYSYEDGIESSQDLLNVASNWFVETGCDKPRVEMEVQFEHLWETEEYKDVAALELVGMGDTITVKHSKLKVVGTAIVNRIEYDVIARKNIAVNVGHVKARFTDKVNEVGNVVERVEQAEQSANQAIRTANGKNTIYYGPDEPAGNYTEDDLWFKVVDGAYTRTYRFDGIQWQLIVSADVKDIEKVATDARKQADQAVANANLATQNASDAIDQAQTAFDEAQTALTTAQGLTNRMSSVEGDISTLSQTTQSFATRIENAEGGISTLTQTAQGLQNRVVDAEGNISSVTQLAEGMQTRLTNAEGSINTLTQTAEGLQSTIDDLEDETQSQITQLSKNINARVEIGDVINQINISTESILISGKKLILDGDTTVTGTFRVKDANITSVDAGKMTTGTLNAGLVNVININASSITTGTLIGIDIQGARFYSQSHTDYMEIVGGNILLQRANGQRLEMSPDGIKALNANGTVRFESNLQITTSAAFGTVNTNVYVGSENNGELRVVNINDIPGGGAIDDYRYNDVRAKHLYANALEANWGVSNAVNIYLRPRAGGEIRVTAGQTTDTYLDLRSRGIFTSYIDLNTSHSSGVNLYLRPAEEVRVTAPGSTTSYRDLRAAGLLANSLDVNTGTHLYARPASGGEFRVTSKGTTGSYMNVRANGYLGNSLQVHGTGVNLYIRPASNGHVRVTAAGTTDSYRNILASDFIPSSSEKWKTNIEKYEGSALDLFRRSVIYQYYKHDSTDLEFGFITERETPREIKRGEGVSSYSLQGLTIKSIQEVDEKVDLTREELVIKIAILEEKIIKLESAA